MPRDRDDDSGEYGRPSPARASRSNTVLFVVLGIVAAVVLLCGGGGIYATLKVREAAQRVQAELRAEEERRQDDPKTKVWDEKELSDAVKGKTPAEVKELLGAPDWTTGNPELEAGKLTAFMYANRLRDAHSGERIVAAVYFTAGKATGKVR